MDLTEGSKTSAKPNLTPGDTPKENTQDSEHGETLKSRIDYDCWEYLNTKSNLSNLSLIASFKHSFKHFVACGRSEGCQLQTF
jgi:hypothetical protein